MAFGTFGNLVNDTGGAPTLVRRPPPQRVPTLQGPGQLPSSASVLSVLNREPGGWTKVALSTALRGLLIMPGIAVGGLRGWRMVGAAALGSATITTFLFVFYGARMDGSTTPTEGGGDNAQ